MAETIHDPGFGMRYADNVRAGGTRRSKSDSIIAPSYSIGELRDAIPHFVVDSSFQEVSHSRNISGGLKHTPRKEEDPHCNLISGDSQEPEDELLPPPSAIRRHQKSQLVLLFLSCPFLRRKSLKRISS